MLYRKNEPDSGGGEEGKEELGRKGFNLKGGRSQRRVYRKGGVCLKT